MMILRPAVQSDLCQLTVIEKTSFDPAYYSRMSHRQFRFHVHSPNAVLIVAEDATGSVQGYALGFLHGARGAIRFYSLAVSPDVQRGEIGKLLFRAIELEAHKRGLGVQCEVRVDNEKLQTRYSALGYKPYKTVPDYYPDGAGCIKYKKSKEDIDEEFRV